MKRKLVAKILKKYGNVRPSMFYDEFHSLGLQIVWLSNSYSKYLGEANYDISFGTDGIVIHLVISEKGDEKEAHFVFPGYDEEGKHVAMIYVSRDAWENLMWDTEFTNDEIYKFLLPYEERLTNCLNMVSYDGVLIDENTDNIVDNIECMLRADDVISHFFDMWGDDCEIRFDYVENERLENLEYISSTVVALNYDDFTQDERTFILEKVNNGELTISPSNYIVLSGFEGEAEEEFGKNWRNTNFKKLIDFINDWDL